MFIIHNRKIFYVLSVILVALSLGALLIFGLRFGIDFKGGSLLEFDYAQSRPDITSVRTELGEMRAIEGYSIRPTGELGFILRTPYIDETTHADLVAVLSHKGAISLKEKRFDSVGPSLGSELQSKALLSLGLVIFAIVCFITFAFRKVSQPVSSWKYGIIAIVALLHDVLIPTGAFAILGHFAGFEIDALFVTALLVILGFSIHDTIVVFDRVRENLRRNNESRRTEVFEETVGKSLSQTFARSINTSLTTVLALLALYFLGSEATTHFALALLIGITAGTYSSLFIGTPLLVTVEKWQHRSS